MSQLAIAGLSPPAIHALTVWDPWLWAITNLPELLAKRIENHPYPPPRWVVGHWIALHAGLKWNHEAPTQIRNIVIRHLAGGDPILSAAELRTELKPRRGHVVALARIDSVIYPVDAADSEMVRPWHFPAEHGWQIGALHRLERPVPCRGYQKVWRLREPARSDVLRQLPPGVVRELARCGR